MLYSKSNKDELNWVKIEIVEYDDSEFMTTLLHNEAFNNPSQYFPVLDNFKQLNQYGLICRLF